MTWPLFAESALTSANGSDLNESRLQTASNYFTIVIASLSTAEQVKWMVTADNKQLEAKTFNQHIAKFDCLRIWKR